METVGDSMLPVDECALVNTEMTLGDAIDALELAHERRREGGCTMKEVRQAAWNPKGITYYNTFKALLAKGLAEKKPDGRMYATTQARNTAINPARPPGG